MHKQDTPFRPPSNKATSFRHAPKPITNEDLMAALNSVLKSDLEFVLAEVAELRAENARPSSEIDILRGKPARLNTTISTQQSPLVVSQVLQETFEGER